jgi:serine/threonine protein kinase
VSDGGIERRRQALALFREAVEIAPAEREAWLRHACGDDPSLRHAVDALLAADASSTEPFAGDALAWGRAFRDEHADVARDALVGRSIGPWRITGILGHGGMGAVYRVDRDDGAYTQHAALKLIRAGTDSQAARERFLRERQILARLRHPNIATLLDGGISGDGDPWFVMELVDGQPIDRWCDARQLDLRQRIVLFLQVVDAVRHAHRNLVVHRDLKPSNLLVDGDGRVKLLDFGIAKELADTARAVTVDRALTFEYASPEQLLDAPITTATDLWQLGVVLHRLLSGAHPFGVTRETPVAHQLQQLERDPEPLTRAASQSSSEQAAQRGGHSPASLARALRGSLAQIVQACLRRDPEARYASADLLANDLRAWLDDRPISAVPLSRADRARLWLRRNRGLATAAGIVMVALVAGSGVALWQAHEARTQARIAERESENARATLTFLADTLAAAAPEQAMSTEVSVRQLLDQARAKLDQRALEPQVRQPVQRMLGRLYRSIGDDQQAVELFSAGLKGVAPQTREEALALADDLVAYSDELGDLERNADSLAAADQAVALRQRFAPDDPEQQLRAMAHLTLGHVEKYGLEACRKRAESSLAFAKRMPSPPVDVVLDIYSDIGTAANFQNDRRRLLSVSREGLAYADAHGIAADSPVRRTLVRSLVSGLLLEGKPAEAERVVRQAIADAEKTGGYGGTSATVWYQTLADTLLGQGRYREALEATDRSYALSSQRGEGPRNLAMALANITAINIMYGDYATALARSTQGISRLDEAGVSPDDSFRRTIERVHARALVANGAFGQAAPRLEDLRARAQRLDGDTSDEYAQVLGDQLNLYLRTHDVARATPMLAELRTRMRQRGVADNHEQFAYFYAMEATLDRVRNDSVAAEQHQREAIRRLEASASAVDVAVARAALAEDVAARGARAEARALMDQALPVMREALLPAERNRAQAEAFAKRL